MRMRKIVGYVKYYFIEVDKRILALSTFFIALFIFINYYFGLNAAISRFAESIQYLCWFAVFLIAFSFAYLLKAFFSGASFFSNRKFVALVVIAPALFAWKMSFTFSFNLSNQLLQNAYWNSVLYWPFKLVVLTGLLYIIWKIFDSGQPFYGITTKNFQPKPYLLMLLLMAPLIAAASTQSDFLAMYPKLKHIQYVLQAAHPIVYKLLFELSYGSDFFSIELFFRGFLVLAFVKWVGKDAILPMALFYCTIHFGKPLGECISSYFGGLLLGIVIYHTRTIFGGLMVHLGIAWLMELGGYLGNIHY